MKTSPEGIRLLKEFESCRLKSYQDQAGVWTIGFGNIRYEDGAHVKSGESITQERADSLFAYTLKQFENKVIGFLRRDVNQNQFDALVSFHYNTGALGDSTLLRKVNRNPDDKSIEMEFLRWNKAHVKGVLVELPGLTKRRQREADFYFKPI